ncbi:hypothetical protein IW148_006041 [Coemansia sp. RSA 1199]|nr:hypothetical protein IW148_006041 [Coemansia sp. RSA 1199]
MDRVDRRNQLSRELKGHGSKMPFETFLAELKLKNEYKTFKHRFRGIFAAIAFRAIAYVKRTAIQPIITNDVRKAVEAELTRNTDADDSVHAHLKCFDSFEALTCFGMKHEPALIRYFDKLLGMAKRAFNQLPSHERKTWLMPSYQYGDNQSKAVAGSSHKVDYTIHFRHSQKPTFDTIHVLVEAKSESSSKISDANFGQIADYAHSLWACQPTRLFVPVLLIHGDQLSLVFGHFCDVTRRIWGNYEFVHRRDSADNDQDSMLVDVNISKDPTDSSINIHSSNRIERTVNLRGRMAHMFKIKHRGKHAILKLAWTPANQLPESAVYDVLKADKIRDIPSIIDSGIIVEDSFGYRVEYMLIEDYGVPLAKHLQLFSSNDANRPSNVAVRAMSQAVECIYGAWKAGILHRNITADSVVVKGGQARIIDWGHAKFAEDGPVDVDALAAKWHFDKNKVAGGDGSSDPITGTLYYASIPVLIGATQRSIADDVESVLYVVIDALSKLNANPPNFGMHRFRGIFAAIAFRAIAYVDEVAVQPTLPNNTRIIVEDRLTRDMTADDSVHAHLKCLDSYKGLECVGLEGENALIKYFEGILRMARHAISGLSSDERKMWPDNSRDSGDHDQDPVLVDVNINDDSTNSSINIYSSDLIERTVSLRGRMAHKFRVKKNRRDYILKLAWTPVDQLPEPAVYDALKASNIPNIPSIIDSGIIIENSFGFRVEYLLIEDYCVPLTKYLLTQSQWDMKWMSDNAARPMSQIVECIYSAWNAGILHRDISADSVVVKGGQVRIIDWDSATLLENSSVDIDAIETKWRFKKETDMYSEYKHESVGTSLYKSIPVLIGATQRSIVDDIESALYVVLESVFKTRPDNLKVEPIALRLESEQSLAFVRGCCLSDVDFYRHAFGIPHCSERFAWLMDTFREYLFVRDGEYIGSKLAMQPRFERTVEIQQLERILEQIKERVYGESPVSNTVKKQSQVGKSSTSVKAPKRSQRLQSKKRRR